MSTFTSSRLNLLAGLSGTFKSKLNIYIFNYQLYDKVDQCQNLHLTVKHIVVSFMYLIIHYFKNLEIFVLIRQIT